jgi:deuterolysin
MKQALAQCAEVAKMAEIAARNGSAARMKEFFKSSDQKTRDSVADVFQKVAAECGGGTIAKMYCNDVSKNCKKKGLLAYTYPTKSYIGNCQAFYDLPALTKKCRKKDRATCTLHETTHLNQIKGTSDENLCYNMDCIHQLTQKQSMNHADTYAFFTNGKVYESWLSWFSYTDLVLLHHSRIRELLDSFIHPSP